MPGAGLAAPALLSLAAAWRAWLALADARHIAATSRDSRAWRPQLGWTTPEQQRRRRRWALLGLASAIVVLAATLGEGIGVLARLATVAGCVGIFAWLTVDRKLHHGRYTSVCIATLAGVVAIGAVPVAGATATMGTFASVAATQLYLVAGIRKLRSSHFLNGGVLVDNLTYGAVAAAAGSRDYLPFPPVCRLPRLLTTAPLGIVCWLGAWTTALVELVLGAGALGLLAPDVTIALGVATHLGFLSLGYRRLVPFSAAAMGLLVVATTHPILAPGGVG